MADSCGKVDCNIDLNLDSQERLITSEALWDSLDSTRRDHVTVLQEVSPPELLDAINERVGESPLTHHTQVCRDECISVEEVNANWKDIDEASVFSVDITSKNNCLQVDGITSYSVSLICDPYVYFLVLYCLG